MRWFVSELINIRKDLKRTPDYVADIEFNWKDIKKAKSIFNIEDKLHAQNKIQEMLFKIKNDGEFLDSFNHFDERRLDWEVLENDNIKITGYQTGLLTRYFKERILKDEKVFGLTTNLQRQNVLTVYGENTGKRIESQEQFRAFCYFLNNPNRIITYLEIFEEFKRGALHDGDYWHNKCPTDDLKEKFVQENVYNLKRKLIEVSKKYDLDIDKHLETISKKGYKYNI